MNNKAKSIRFSIIIAAYNIEDYIQRAIQSVEKQTFKNFELIIIDDSSNDKTKEKISEMCEKYNNIIFFTHNENKKLGSARNTGLQVASGEYILYLDGDDYLAEDNVLERLNSLIGEDKPDVVYLGFKMEGTKNDLVIPTEETCTRKYKIALDKYPNAWSKCWRNEFLKEHNIKFPAYRNYEDVIYVYKAIMKVQSYKVADFVVHKYTSGREGSITTRIEIKNIEDNVQNIKELLKMREEEQTEEIDLVIKREINKCKKRLDGVYETVFYKQNNNLN